LTPWGTCLPAETLLSQVRSTEEQQYPASVGTKCPENKKMNNQGLTKQQKSQWATIQDQ
jgi:secreted PhoX family phosphatase